MQGQATRAERGTWAERGYPANWDKLRARILARDPVCVACGRKCSDTVDHVLPLERGGSNDPENLQGLDHSCHSIKTTIERGVMAPAEVMRLLVAKVSQ